MHPKKPSAAELMELENQFGAHNYHPLQVVLERGVRKKGLMDNAAQIVVCENNFHGRTTTIDAFE